MVSFTLGIATLGLVFGRAPEAAGQDPPEKAAPPAAKAEEAAPDDNKAPDAKADQAPLESPPPIPRVNLLPVLPTVPHEHGKTEFNVRMVDASVLPRDKEGIWVLDFAFKPMRLKTIEVPGKGRKILHYLYYRVVNRTKEPRNFVPQFTLVTDTGKRKEEAVLPQAVKLIQMREDPSIPLLGAVSVDGVIPPSTKEGVDDAVYGVAIWEDVDPHADAIHIFVRGLSDGYKRVPVPGGSDQVTRYKTLKIDFIRRGDERNLNEKEIMLNDPPYEWIYW
jgi:hypothetical protein